MTNAVKGVKGFVSVDVSARFWSKVEKRGPDECWPWLGTADQKGRGHFYMDGRSQRAPRIAWALRYATRFPDELDACHTCDNPNCVNPAHIWPGTASQNAKDAVRKGRVVPPTGLTHNAARTHCKNGHPFDSANTIARPDGRRACRTCQREHGRAHDARRRAMKVRAIDLDALLGQGEP